MPPGTGEVSPLTRRRAAVAGCQIHAIRPSSSWSYTAGPPMSSTRASRPVSSIKGNQAGRHVAGVNRLEAHAKAESRNSAGEKRWIANIVSIRSRNCVTRMIVWPRAGRGQPFLDAQLGLVVAHRDAIDPDDRDVDDDAGDVPVRRAAAMSAVRRHRRLFPRAPSAAQCTNQPSITPSRAASMPAAVSRSP